MKKKNNSKLALPDKNYTIQIHMDRTHGEHVKKISTAKVHPYGPTRSAADAIIAHVRWQMDNGAERICVQMMSTYFTQSPKPFDIGGVVKNCIKAPVDENDTALYAYELSSACLFWTASSDKQDSHRVCYTYVPRESANKYTAVEEANDSRAHFVETLEILKMVFSAMYLVEKYAYHYQCITITKTGSTAMFLHEEIYNRH